MNFQTFNKLSEYSNNSQLTHKHAAAIIYNGKVVSYGVNNLNGGRADHAEIAVITRFLKDRGWCQKQKWILPDS